ncbi:hypothetical protein M8C21_033614 [Ambrosia artemisiifolia]|uniref:Uncharacterized protein n=1 Tax=Ambrosia artemisiifolia TaxID=4212 RepID=A0AAD5C0T5_AMBAR|nr:hypothetical protein M8C21_033614 [Ambrosia artemisiifolia]
MLFTVGPAARIKCMFNTYGRRMRLDDGSVVSTFEKKRGNDRQTTTMTYFSITILTFHNQTSDVDEMIDKILQVEELR